MLLILWIFIYLTLTAFAESPSKRYLCPPGTEEEDSGSGYDNEDYEEDFEDYIEEDEEKHSERKKIPEFDGEGNTMKYKQINWHQQVKKTSNILTPVIEDNSFQNVPLF